ncbi:MAG: hypothetical protein L0Z62_27880 [Gemmataceae bacterium]|nr:hypothetical protein [Gemmataceae bacterium]
MMFRSTRFIPLFACGLAVVAIPACGQSGPKLHPVRGKVTVRGKPAAHALVFLHRVGRTDPSEPVPYGQVGNDGQFVLTTRKDGDGARPGDYVITVYWPDMSKPEDGNGQRPDALNGAYDKPAASKLKAVVKAEENTLPPLDLTPGPPRKVGHDPSDK